MAKSEVDKVTEERIAKGGVLARLYFDVQHQERDKLQPLLVDLVNNRLMKEKGIVYCYGSVEEPLEKDGTFITSATVTVLFEGFPPMIAIAFRYAPAGIEILRPEKEMRFTVSELQSLLMDVSQISLEYSNFILQKVLKPEDVATIKKQLENRAELGKKMLDKKPEDGE